MAAYQQKLQAFQKLGKQIPDPALKDKATELETLQTSMQEFQANADSGLRAKYASMFPKIDQIVKTAITECAKELQVT